MSSIEERVEIWQDLVADIERSNGRVNHILRERGWVLIWSIPYVVVTRVRIEGTDLLPSSTQFFVGCARETANVCTNIWARIQILLYYLYISYY